MDPNIVIIVLDAVRAQNLPLYGYHRITTPFLCSIENELAIYENAISSSYWTMPSIASLFTGMYTSGHGLVSDGDKIDKSLLTLPAVLQQYGYHSAGFVRNIYVSEYSGLNSGFEDFISKNRLDTLKKAASFVSEKWVSRLQPPGITRSLDDPPDNWNSRKKDFSNVIARCFDVLIDRGSSHFLKEFSNWLDGNRSKKFFTYMHIFETHSPYRTPLNFALKFSSLRDNYKKLFINHDHLKFLLGKSQMSPEDFKILLSFYDNSICYADHIIAKIFQLLKQYDVFNDTMIVILSDHGDNIGDHGMMFHYFCLYDTLIKIPLLIKFPTSTGLKGRVSDVVQNVDIFPTILSLLDIDDNNVWQQVQGNDLLGKAPPKREPNLAVSELVKVFGPDRNQYRDQLNQFDSRLLSIRTGNRKFIYSSRGEHECYDLSKDPAEMKNLYPHNNSFSDLMEKARKYYEKMDMFYMLNKEKIDGDADIDNIEKSTIDQLKSLGYM